MAAEATERGSPEEQSELVRLLEYHLLLAEGSHCRARDSWPPKRALLVGEQGHSASGYLQANVD